MTLTRTTQSIIKIIAALFAVTAVLAACATPPPVPVNINDLNAGETINLKVAQGLTVELPSTPSRGFSWQVTNIDTNVLTQVGQSKFKASSAVADSPGVETLTFQAFGPGTTALELGYVSSADKNAPPAKTYGVTVVVTDSKGE
jgi:inhibitor of cysteine peptidase